MSQWAQRSRRSCCLGWSWWSLFPEAPPTGTVRPTEHTYLDPGAHPRVHTEPLAQGAGQQLGLSPGIAICILWGPEGVLRASSCFRGLQQRRHTGPSNLRQGPSSWILGCWSAFTSHAFATEPAGHPGRTPLRLPCRSPQSSWWFPGGSFSSTARLERKDEPLGPSVPGPCALQHLPVHLSDLHKAGPPAKMPSLMGDQPRTNSGQLSL